MKLNRDYSYRYTLTEFVGSWNHSYSVETEHGAIELHITEYPDGLSGKPMESSGGVEFHYRKPPDYMKGKAPSHPECIVLGRNPCWHDGSSTWAMEHFLPLWERRMSEREMFEWLVPHVGRLNEIEYSPPASSPQTPPEESLSTPTTSPTSTGAGTSPPEGEAGGVTDEIVTDTDWAYNEGYLAGFKAGQKDEREKISGCRCGFTEMDHYWRTDGRRECPPKPLEG